MGSTEDQLTIHSDYGSARANLLTGSFYSWKSLEASRYHKVLLHGIIMTVSKEGYLWPNNEKVTWTVGIPFGVFLASAAKKRLFASSLAWHRNWMMMVIAIAAGVGLYIGWFQLMRKNDSNGHSMFLSPVHLGHFVLGILTTASLVVQIGLGILSDSSVCETSSPNPRKGRCTTLHTFLGRAIWMLGIVNIFFGFQVYPGITMSNSAN